MGLFTPPKTKYTNYYDQSRYNLVWRVSLVYLILMSVVTLLNMNNPHSVILPNLISLTLALLALIVLKKTKKYEFISAFITVCFTIIIGSVFFKVINAIHFTTPMWMILNIIFAFFSLGKIWGVSILSINFVFVIFYFYFRLESNIQHLPPLTEADIFNYALDYAICGLGIAYFLFEFVKSNQYAEENFKLSNETLNRQNEIISGQNKEKETMLKEIHHRVKNNLQVITSLLRLQAHDLGEETISKEFNDAINRVKAMSLIHEKMYQKDMLANFDLEAYLNSMATDLISTYSLEKDVELIIQSDINNINSKTIVPLALLFNELISNSIKHAFDQIQEPIITVKVTPRNNNFFQLIYADNGIWKENSSQSFGQELITTMTEQLDGEMDLIHSQEGTQYTFLLKNIAEDVQEKI